MAKFELNSGEVLLNKGQGTFLQGDKVKAYVTTRYFLTNTRFVFHDMGGWAVWWSGLGFLLKLLIKGKRMEMPLTGLKISRGKYALNKDLVMLEDASGRQAQLSGFKRWTKLFQETFNGQNGLSMVETGTEEWAIR